MSHRLSVGLCVFECLAEVVGEEAARALFKYGGITVEDVATEPSKLTGLLRGLFGSGADQLERALAHALARRLGLGVWGAEPTLEETIEAAAGGPPRHGAA